MSRAAQAYAARLRWSVFPLLPASKKPHAELAPHGFLDASTCPDVIAKWWHQDPGAGIGVSCVASDFFVLDVDPRNGGDEELVRLLEEHGSLPTTPIQRTGSNGAHYLFRKPRGAILRGKIAKGLDLKDAGYIVAAPSIHPNGASYAWDRASHPLRVPVAAAPLWLLALATKVEEPPPAPRPIRTAREGEDDRIERARRWLAKRDPAISGQGGHAHTFLTASAIVRGFDVDEATATALLLLWNLTCEPPWSEKDIKRKIREATHHGSMSFGELLQAPRRRAS